jgi:ketosteroid isomerase-like protein
MSQQNVEIVEAAVAAYMVGDVETVRRLMDPNVVISTRPGQPDVGDHHGYEGLLQTAAEWLDAWDAHTFEAARFWSSGELVFIAVQESGRGRASGVPMENESTFVFALSEGRIVSLRIFGSEREALKGLGLEE